MQETGTPPSLPPDPAPEPVPAPLSESGGTLATASDTPVAPPARSWPGPLRGLWRSRAALAGLVALALALLGESLMRSPAGIANPNPQADLGSNLMRLAVVLVGLVAWVRDGWRLGATPAPAPAPVSTSLPTRRADSTGVRVAGARRNGRGPQPDRLAPLRAWADRLAATRRRLGWTGTAIGLLIVAGLAAWCYFLLRQDFGNPLAPWVWLAMLVALALTFVGLAPGKDTGPTGLLPHDPEEPAAPPPMTRGEWLAIGAILLLAIVVRIWNLDQIPMGPYTDEGDRAIDARHINRGEPFNQSTFLFFGTGWWGVPSLYFWLVAQSLKVFGDNLAGARMIHALAGILTVWYTYRLGRAVWSPRVGLLAAALLAVSDFAIQFSRTAGESTITLFTWTACFYYLYRALQTRRPLDFVLAGLAGGFTLYGYVAGKLLPLFLVLVALYVLARWGLRGIRRYLPGLVLTALTMGLVFAPNGLYLLSPQAGDAFTVRYNGVSIFSPDNANALRGTYNTDNWGVIVARQFGLTYSAFDVGQERGPFYPTHQPILPVPWAALWLLGGAYILWRAGDARFAILGIWILSGLAGAALTNDTPTLQRVAGLVPTLALVPALYLDRVARAIPPLRARIRRPALARFARPAMAVLTALLVVVMGAETLSFYFGPYTAAANYYWWTLAGRYAEKLDPAHDAVYQMDVPEFFWWGGPALFLADRVQGRDLANVSDELPFTSNDGKNAHFLVFPSNQQYMSVLQAYYPGGQQHVVNRPDGTPFFTAYEVDMAQFDAQRQIRARYGHPGGPLFEQWEPRLGTLGPEEDSPAIQPPSWMTYPLTVDWSGGLRAPAYGAYRLRLTAPAGAALEIDGRQMLTATVGSNAPSETRVVLASGLHQIRLTGTLENALTPVELRWSTDTGVFVPVARAYLWGGPQGTLLGQAYPDAPALSWVTDPVTPTFTTPPQLQRRDGVLGWRSTPDRLGGGLPPTIWRGSFHVPTTGVYGFEAATDSKAAVWVDGHLVDGNTGVQVAGMAGATRLTAGDHSIEVRYQPQRANSWLDLYWLPPGGQREIMPPGAFLPGPGGALFADEAPGAPSLDPALITAAPPVVPMQVAGTISGDWLQARGVAVLPNGQVVVGDTGHHRLVVYSPDGKQQAAWGSDGTGDGRFANVSDVAASGDGTIAALDAGNGDVQLFAADGKQLGHLTHDQLGIMQSSGITWGPDGQIYIGDTAGARLVRASRDGQQVAAFHDGDTTHAALDQALDVAVTPDGTIYAVDLRHRVVRFNAAGQIDHEWAVPVGAERGGSHLALWNGYLAITGAEGNSLALLDLSTGVLHSLQVADPSFTLAMPIGIATGPDGRLYILDSNNNRVVILEAAP